MNSDSFEKAFDDFLARKEYDKAENALFEMVRISFAAGWLAAGGDALKPQKLFELLDKSDKVQSTAKSNLDDWYGCPSHVDIIIEHG